MKKGTNLRSESHKLQAHEVGEQQVVQASATPALSQMHGLLPEGHIAH